MRTRISKNINKTAVADHYASQPGHAKYDNLKACIALSAKQAVLGGSNCHDRTGDFVAALSGALESLDEKQLAETVFSIFRDITS